MDQTAPSEADPATAGEAGPAAGEAGQAAAGDADPSSPGDADPSSPGEADRAAAGVADPGAGDADPSSGVGARRWIRAVLVVLGAALIWVALVIPGDFGQTGAIAMVRIPLEALAIVLLAVLVPARPLRPVAAVVGVLLGLLVILKGFDIGFESVFDRPFDVMGDWYYLGPAVGVLADSSGRAWAVVAVVGAIVGVIAVLTILPVAMVAVTGVLARHRRRAVAVLTVLAVAWAGLALTGTRVAHGVPAASANTSRLAWSAIDQLRNDASDRETFARDIATDRYAHASAGSLLAGLRGKDVLLVFVESYGRVALDDPRISRIVRPALNAANRDLAGAGVSARSAFLNSPTFGGASWLAHSTVQSGLWVDSQQRYEQLLAADRLTLTRAFSEAGWRTAFAIPEMTGTWPQGQPFYGFDRLITANDLGYGGPRYGYALMPDQFTLSRFRQLALRPGHTTPVMAEIDLLSSHSPWETPPRLLPWASVGDGSVYQGPAGRSVDERTAASDDVHTRYARTVAYTMRTLASFAATSTDPNLVILAMGDHQPATSVSGPDASHEVPVMLITRDRQVLDRVSGWNWTDGLQPAADAPVWPMDTVRNRILTTFRGSS